MTLTVASMREVVQRDLASLGEPDVVNGVLRVLTQVLYPSHGLVRVSLRPQGEGLSVSDDGGALYEARSAGANVNNPARALSHLLSPYGLRMAGDVITSLVVPPEKVVGAIILVANASREAAEWIYNHSKVKSSRDFRKLLADLLLMRYEGSVSQNAKIVGASNKAHIFPHVLKAVSGKSLLIDPVMNDPSSINSRVVANLDVRNTNNSQLEQRIVYDDYEMWDPANINILGTGAKAVPFSRLESVIQRLSG